MACGSIGGYAHRVYAMCSSNDVIYNRKRKNIADFTSGLPYQPDFLCYFLAFPFCLMLTHGRFLLTDPQLSGIDDIARYFEGNGFRILKELVQNWPIRRSCEEVLMQHLTYMRSTFLINSSLNLLLSTNSHVAMGKFYESISDDLRDWALRQSVFFVASAPLRGRHVNLSPKGLPDSCLAFFGPNQVAYIDSTGSGCETISHVRENGRITLMFCSFETSPRILRLFSTGTVIEWDQPEFDECVQRMGKTPIAGARAIIQLDVFKVSICLSYDFRSRINRLLGKQHRKASQTYSSQRCDS